MLPRPHQGGDLTSALRGVDNWGWVVGERCDSVRGEGARTLKPGTAGSLPPRPSLLSAPHLPQPQPAAAQPLSSPPFRLPSPWAPTRPPPQTTTRPAPVLPLAPSGFRALGPGLHAANWAARAGAEARGFFFTRSLKYFGKPQSGAARKWPLACFGESGGGDGGLELR